MNVRLSAPPQSGLSLVRHFGLDGDVPDHSSFSNNRNGCLRQPISAVRGDLIRPHLATSRADYGNKDQAISGMSFT
jgi:hypothetical protein